MEKKLRTAIRRYPCLWQVKAKAYRDVIAKENAWKEVFAVAGESVDDCIRKWKSLRDKFVRELKKDYRKKVRERIQESHSTKGQGTQNYRYDVERTYSVNAIYVALRYVTLPCLTFRYVTLRELCSMRCVNQPF